MDKFKCPHCNETIDPSLIASSLGRTGGRKGGLSTSESKRQAGRENLEKARAVLLERRKQ